MKVHVYGKNKPNMRWFDEEGNYREWKTASYSSHRIADTMSEAQKIVTEMLSKNWDVSIKIE